MDLARFAIEKRVISALATLLILAAGIFAYSALPRFEDPAFLIRQAQVVTPYPGASAEEVALEVSEVLENALQQLRGVKEVRSVSSPGVSRISVEFTIKSAGNYPELNQLFSQMRAKVSDAQSSLPPNALASQVYDDFGDVYALYFAVTGEGYSISELNEYAKDLQRDLVGVKGVSKVVLNGVQHEVIYVEYSPARLIELKLTTQQISDVLKGQNLVTPGGSIVAGSTRITVRAQGAVESISAIESLMIANPKYRARLFGCRISRPCRVALPIRLHACCIGTVSQPSEWASRMFWVAMLWQWARR